MTREYAPLLILAWIFAILWLGLGLRTLWERFRGSYSPPCKHPSSKPGKKFGIPQEVCDACGATITEPINWWRIGAVGMVIAGLIWWTERS
jgi:hypothetical protein